MVADPTLPLEPILSVVLDSASRPALIALDREASFDLIRDDLRALLGPAKDVWDGAEVHLDLGQREPDLFHLRRLVHLLKDEFGVHVVGMRCDPAALRRFAERELKVRIHLAGAPAEPPPAPDHAPESTPEPTRERAPEPTPEPTPERASPDVREPASTSPSAALWPEPSEDLLPEPTEPEPTGSREGPDGVRVEVRTLRSGAVLRHGGDVVLYGDVNPGAEILAGGNITVLGTLMGVVHAGTRLGERAWVLALDLKATQLRIGPHILIPGSPGPTAGRPVRAAELALVRDGAIVIEPWRGRLPREDTRRSDA